MNHHRLTIRWRTRFYEGETRYLVLSRSSGRAIDAALVAVRDDWRKKAWEKQCADSFRVGDTADEVRRRRTAPIPDDFKINPDDYTITYLTAEPEDTIFLEAF